MGTQVVECLSAHEHIGVFGLIVLVGPFVRHGKQENLLLTKDILQVVKKVGSFFFVLEHDKVTGPYTFVNCGKQDGIQASRETFNPDGF
jgi:hypothetical protein